MSPGICGFAICGLPITGLLAHLCLFQEAQRDRHLRYGWDDPAEHEEPAGVPPWPREAGTG